MTFMHLDIQERPILGGNCGRRGVGAMAAWKGGGPTPGLDPSARPRALPGADEVAEAAGFLVVLEGV